MKLKWVVMAVVLGCALPVWAQDTWEAKGLMARGRIQHAAASVDGYLYVFAGTSQLGRSFSFAHGLDRYDPVTDAWTPLASITTYQTASGIGWTHAAGVAWGGNLYQFAGWLLSSYGTFHDGSSWKYDIAANTWTQRADMPVQMDCARAAALASGILVIGSPWGVTGPGRAYEYNPNANTWTRRADLPDRIDYAHVSAINGSAYLAGGEISGVPSARTLKFEPGATAWIPMADMPSAKSGGAAAAAKMHLYVIGGYPEPFDTVYEFSPALDEWIVRASMKTGAYSNAAAMLRVEGLPKIHSTGGTDEITGRLRVNDAYTPPTFSKPDAPGALVMRLPDGTILAEGGWTGSATLILGATVNDPAGNPVQLEVEVIPAASPFTGTPTAVSNFGPPGLLSTPVDNLSQGPWKWRCRARNSNDEINDGGWQEFQTPAVDFNVDLSPPTTPAGLFPSNQDVVVLNRSGGPVGFGWTAAVDDNPAGIAYDIEVSGSPDFDTIIATGRIAGETETSIVLAPSAFERYWRVRSIDAGGNVSVQWSVPLRFRVTWNDNINHGAGDAVKVCGFGGSGSSVGFSALLVIALAGMLGSRRR